MTIPNFRYFDPADDVAIVERRLPHWSQAETICFITWRTWDSMPRAVLGDWVNARDRWLGARGIDTALPGWEALVERLPPEDGRALRQMLAERWEAALDACHGSCPLRRPDLASVVADSLRHFDGDRYTLFDFVVMPKHVHLLAAFPGDDQMRDQCESWKHYTAVRLNKLLGRSGRFWESDSFDHLVRSDEQFLYLRRHIAENPVRAGLTAGEFTLYSRVLLGMAPEPLAERADHYIGAKP